MCVCVLFAVDRLTSTDSTSSPETLDSSSIDMQHQSPASLQHTDSTPEELSISEEESTE